MPRRKRDYRAEYRRRIAKGLAQGLSRSQARGHPKAPERHRSRKKQAALEDHRQQLALKSLRQGKSLTASAREVGLSPERLRHFLSTTRAGKKRGRRWFVRDDLPRRMLLYSAGQAIAVTVSHRKAASEIGRFMNAMKQFLRTGDVGYLAPFAGEGITDIAGKRHRFETDPEALYRIEHATEESFPLVYRFVV